MSFQYFDSQQRDLVTHVTMRNTGKHNAFNAVMSAELVDALSQAEQARSRAVILRAEPGVKVWSAGHDISELPVGDDDPLQWKNTLADMMDEVAAFPRPLIVGVEGGVWGGACELVMAADIVVALESTTFAITPAKLGVAYSSAGISRFLAALPVHIVKEMFFTATPLSAHRAYDLGLVNHLVPDEPRMEAVCSQLADRIAELAPLTIRSMKAEAQAITLPAHTADQADELEALRSAAWASRDYQEGIAAFGQRRSPEFKGN